MKKLIREASRKYCLIMLLGALGLGVGCQTTQPAQSSEAPVSEAAADESGADEGSAEKVEEKTADEAAAPHGHAHTPEEAAKEAEAVKKQGLAADLEAGKTGTYGAPFTIEEAPITLASAIEKVQSSEGDDGFYKISGRIEQVCQKKGCWFTLQASDVDHPVRVRMKDYGFFVPKNVAGAEAVVEGTLKKRTIPQAEAQHYADDAAVGSEEAAEKVTEDQVVWEMTIVAAKIVNRS